MRGASLAATCAALLLGGVSPAVSAAQVKGCAPDDKTNHAWALDDRLSPEYDLLEKSWVGGSPAKVPYTGPTGVPSEASLLLEADLVPHLGIIGVGFGEPHIQCGWRGKISWVFTPQVHLRMLSTYSDPVIPVSFQPRPLQFQLLLRRLELDDSSAQSGPGLETDLTVTFTAWAHHSNGQTGCFYRNQTYHPPDTATMDPGGCMPNGAGPLNEHDGSFSTNFLELSAGYRHARSTLQHGPSDGVAAVGGLQYHPEGYLPGGLSQEQAALWGNWQAWVHAEGFVTTCNGGRLLLEGEGRVVLDRVQPASAGGPTHTFTTRLRASYVPRRWFGVGFFAMGEYGQDTYNILFTHGIGRIVGGLLVDWSRNVQVQDPINDDATKDPNLTPKVAPGQDPMQPP